MNLSEEQNGDFYATIYSDDLANYHQSNIEMEDTKWAIGSIAFMFLYLTFHMGSLILSSYAIFMMIYSLAVTQLLYIGAFKINLFNQSNNILLFTLFCIFVNSVFIVYDAWRQSQ